MFRIDRRFLVPILSAGLLLAGAACSNEEGPTMPGRVQSETPSGDDTGSDENPAGGVSGSDDAGVDAGNPPPAGGEDLPTGSGE